MGFFEKLKQGLAKTHDNIFAKVDKLVYGKSKIDEATLEQIEEILSLPSYKNGEQIVMRPPKVRDIRAVASYKNEEEKEIRLISNLTGITTTELDDIDFKDYLQLQKKLQSFLS